MNEKLIDVKTAKLAKTKGFDIHTEYGYTKEGKKRLVCSLKSDVSISDQVWIKAPTQSILRKWLRETHNLLIEVIWNGNEEFYFIIKVKEILGETLYESFDDHDIGHWNIYEEALESGLYEALKLIK